MTGTHGIRPARVWCSDRNADFYTWSCACGTQGDRDYLHRDYAADGWREHAGLDPVVSRPLV